MKFLLLITEPLHFNSFLSPIYDKKNGQRTWFEIPGKGFHASELNRMWKFPNFNQKFLKKKVIKTGFKDLQSPHQCPGSGHQGRGAQAVSIPCRSPINPAGAGARDCRFPHSWKEAWKLQGSLLYHSPDRRVDQELCIFVPKAGKQERCLTEQRVVEPTENACV